MFRRIACEITLTVAVLTGASLRASAAMCAHWDPPTNAAVEGQAVVSFSTYEPVAKSDGSYRLRSHAFPEYPFKVLAVSPSGEVVDVVVVPSDSDPTRWVGRFEPGTPGTWTLQVENLQAADSVCYEDEPLTVEASGSSALQKSALAVGLVLVATAARILIGRRRRA
jgi:hypothetical protein